MNLGGQSLGALGKSMCSSGKEKQPKVNGKLSPRALLIGTSWCSANILIKSCFLSRTETLQRFFFPPPPLPCPFLLSGLWHSAEGNMSSRQKCWMKGEKKRRVRNPSAPSAHQNLDCTPTVPFSLHPIPGSHSLPLSALKGSRAHTNLGQMGRTLLKNLRNQSIPYSLLDCSSQPMPREALEKLLGLVIPKPKQGRFQVSNPREISGIHSFMLNECVRKGRKKRNYVNVNRLDLVTLEVFSSLKNPFIPMSLPGSMGGLFYLSCCWIIRQMSTLCLTLARSKPETNV